MTDFTNLHDTVASCFARIPARWLRAAAQRAENYQADNAKNRIEAASSITKLPKVSSAVVVLVSVLALAGWIFDSEFLRGVIPHAVAMNPMTAVAFVLSSISLWLSRPKISDTSHPFKLRLAIFVCSATVVLIGLVTFLGYTTGWPPTLP